MKKVVKWLVVLLVLFVGGFVALNWVHIKSFPGIISAFYAKEFCSCFFVEGLSEEACHNYARQWVPISSFTLNKDEKTVTVGGLGRTTTVKYTGERYGCAYAHDP
ncbi:MAG: hypothetical protein NZM25_04010 [Leptospiraceae bacterium]|nr:hypothetical protein [Leptospiraceae bacterium]MDW8306151.1 hypothetical protein [Leptospiraceae bacterium]